MVQHHALITPEAHKERIWNAQCSGAPYIALRGASCDSCMLPTSARCMAVSIRWLCMCACVM